MDNMVENTVQKYIACHAIFYQKNLKTKYSGIKSNMKNIALDALHDKPHTGAFQKDFIICSKQTMVTSCLIKPVYSVWKEMKFCK